MVANVGDGGYGWERATDLTIVSRALSPAELRSPKGGSEPYPKARRGGNRRSILNDATDCGIGSLRNAAGRVRRRPRRVCDCSRALSGRWRIPGDGCGSPARGGTLRRLSPITPTREAPGRASLLSRRHPYRGTQSRDHSVRVFGSATPSMRMVSTTSLKKHIKDAMRGHSAMGRG